MKLLHRGNNVRIVDSVEGVGVAGSKYAERKIFHKTETGGKSLFWSKTWDPKLSTDTLPMLASD